MGTRFSLFLQPPYSDFSAEPEVVTVSSPAGSVLAGPSDHRMYVVEPLDKRAPYGLRLAGAGLNHALPPWRGAIAEPALPGPDGHFDHYRPDEPGFAAQHVFGCVRFTLDVWERYVGQPLDWHFRRHLERLEILILRDWDNAQFGYGFLEVGGAAFDALNLHPFSLDFDVIAHETGHAFTYSMLGHPRPGTEHPQYAGFEEAFADMVSLIAVMHFPSVVDQVLSATSGNLHIANHLARFSEMPGQRQLRTAANTLTMHDFPDGAPNEHELSQPLTGAFFDMMVAMFEAALVENDLLPPGFDMLPDGADDALLMERFDRAFARDPQGFRQALLAARDTVGHYLAELLWRMSPDHLTFGRVAATLVEIDSDLGDGANRHIIAGSFAGRGIIPAIAMEPLRGGRIRRRRRPASGRQRRVHIHV